MSTVSQKKNLIYPILLICFIYILSTSAQAAGSGHSTSAETQTSTGESDSSPTLPFFLLIAGSISAVLIPLIVLIILLFSWAACDMESIRILRNLNSIKRLKRIVVSQDVWDQLLADPALRKEMADAGLKIRVKQVERDSPLANSIIKMVRMKSISVQALELAMMENLRYVWIEGNYIKVGRFTKNMKIRSNQY